MCILSQTTLQWTAVDCNYSWHQIMFMQVLQILQYIASELHLPIHGNTTVTDPWNNFLTLKRQNILKTQYIMMTSSNGNFFRVTCILCGETTGHRWIPWTKGSDAERWCFFICAWINGWVNIDEADDLRRHHAHYGVIVMCLLCLFPVVCVFKCILIFNTIFFSLIEWGSSFQNQLMWWYGVQIRLRGRQYF